MKKLFVAAVVAVALFFGFAFDSQKVKAADFDFTDYEKVSVVYDSPLNSYSLRIKELENSSIAVIDFSAFFLIDRNNFPVNVPDGIINLLGFGTVVSDAIPTIIDTERENFAFAMSDFGAGDGTDLYLIIADGLLVENTVIISFFDVSGFLDDLPSQFIYYYNDILDTEHLYYVLPENKTDLILFQKGVSGLFDMDAYSMFDFYALKQSVIVSPVSSLIDTISSLIIGLVGFVGVAVGGAVSLFYTDGAFTLIGILALMGVALGLFGLVYKLIKSFL